MLRVGGHAFKGSFFERRELGSAGSNSSCILIIDCKNVESSRSPEYVHEEPCIDSGGRVIKERVERTTV